MTISGYIKKGEWQGSDNTKFDKGVAIAREENYKEVEGLLLVVRSICRLNPSTKFP